mmetsp:Transcript_13445/g.14455  ORF Transcript_13445/g.14455 Transcript_13445/m.14455 type:complete len:117 (-) Transcript_13445:146-496(-)
MPSSRDYHGNMVSSAALGNNNNNATSSNNNAINSSTTTAQMHLQSAANSQVRLGQLFDENDHKRCSEGNRKALLAENLDQLRGLVKVLETDDWKYSTNAGSASTLAVSSSASSTPA